MQHTISSARRTSQASQAPATQASDCARLQPQWLRNQAFSPLCAGHPCWKGAWPATDFNQPADDVRRFLGPISNPEGARLNPKTGRGTGGGRPWAVPDVSGVYLARDSNNRCCEPGSPVHTFKEDRCAQHRCSTVAKYHLVYTRDAATALLHQHCAAAAAGSTGATLESAFEKLQFANNVARFGSLAGQTVYYPKDGVALFIETAAQLRADSDSPRAKVASPRGKRSAPAPERSMSAPAAAGAAAGVRATRASRRRTTSSDGAQASPAAGSPAAAAAGAAEQPAAGSDHIAALAAELVHSLGPVLPALCSMSENPIADIMTAVGSMTDDTPMHAAQTIATYATLPHPPPLDTSGMHGPPATEGVPMSMEEAVRIVTDAMNSTPAQLAMQPATQAAASDRSGLTVSAAVSMRGPMQCNQADSALLAHNPSPHAEEVGSGLLLAGMQRPDTPGFPLAPVHATMTNTASQPSPQQSQGAIGMRERAGQAWSPLLCMGMQATQVAGGEQRAAQVLPSPAPQQQHRSAAMKCDTPSHRNRSVGHSPPETDTSPYADLPITAVPPPPSLRTTYAALSNPVQQVQTCMSAGSVLHKQDDTNGTDECTMQLVPHTRTPQHVWATHEVVAILVNPRLSLDQQRDAFAKLLSDIRVLSESGDDAAALQLLTGLREGDVHGRSLVQLLVTPRARLVDPTRSYYGDDRPAGKTLLACQHTSSLHTRITVLHGHTGTALPSPRHNASQLLSAHMQLEGLAHAT